MKKKAVSTKMSKTGIAESLACHRPEEIRVHEGSERPCRDRHHGGEEIWKVCSSRVGDDQDEAEEDHAGWKEGNLRQGCPGEGHEGQNRREGLCCFRPEEQHLR